MKNICDLLKYHAEVIPNSIAYTYLVNGENLENNITYKELYFKACSTANLLLKNCKKGDRVLLIFQPGVEFIIAFWGCLYSGVIAIPIYPPKHNRHSSNISNIISDCNPAAVLTTSNQVDYYKRYFEASSEIEVVGLSSNFTSRNVCKNEVINSDIAFIQYTSGSTNSPKGVVITHQNLVINESLIKKTFEIDNSSVIVGWLPFYHDMGLIGNILQPVFSGCRCILMAPIHFLQKPVRWLEAITKYKASISGGPNFSYDLCVNKILEEEIKKIDLTSWKIAFNGAERIHMSSIKRFSEKFACAGFLENAFLPCYGLAESTLLVSGYNVAEKPKSINIKTLNTSNVFEEAINCANNNTDLVSCGKPDGYNVIIVDENGNNLQDGVIGEIWINGESVAKGYWNNNKMSELTFKAISKSSDLLYLKTGDLGCLIGGELYIAGRAKDLIIKNGRNFYPDDIEVIVESAYKELKKNVTAAISVDVNNQEDVVIITEISNNKNLDLEFIETNIKQCIYNEFGFYPLEVIFIRRGSIPKTTSGKIKHSECRKMYLNNEFVRLSDIIQIINYENVDGSNELVKQISAIIIDEVGNDRFSQITNILSLGLNSIQTTRIAYKLNEKFNVKFSTDFIYHYHSIEMIADFIVNSNNLHELERIIMDKYEASDLQQSIWFNQMRSPMNSGYNIPIIIEFGSELNIDLIKGSLDYLLDIHPVYRTIFIQEDNKLYQNVLKDYDVVINVFDTSEFSYEEIVKRESCYHFDLSHDLLIRASIINSTLLFVFHHIIVDGTSISLFVGEFSKLYKNSMHNIDKLLIKSENYSFIDFLAYEKKISITGKYENDQSFWERQLKDLPNKICLPVDFNSKSDREAGAYYFEIENQNWIREYCSQNMISEFSLFLSAYYFLLNHISGENDIIVGCPVSLKNKEEFFSTHGLMINNVMFRNKIDVDELIGKICKKVYRYTCEVLKHSRFHTSKIAERVEFDIEEQLGITSFYLNYLDLKGNSEKINIENYYPGNLGVDLNFDFNLYIFPQKERILLRLDYHKNKFKKETVEFIAELYLTFVESILYKSNESLNQLKLRHLTTVSNNNASNDLTFNKDEIEKTINERFEFIVFQHKDKIAVKTECKNYTYHELYTFSNNIANYILRFNVNRKAIGLLYGHDINMVIGILSIINSGNYYIPLDASYPKERLIYIVEDAQVEMILTCDEFVKLAIDIKDIVSHKIDVLNTSILQCESVNFVNVKCKSDDLAYILYTSGSTGVPKGVMQSHEYVMHLTYNFTKSLNITSIDCLTLIPSFSFSASVMDLFGALLNGASCYLLDIKKVGFNGLFNGINNYNITIYHSVPTLFRAVCNEIIKNKEKHFCDLSNIRIVYLAGESVLRKDFDMYKLIFDDKCLFVNGLGCTEFNICRQLFFHKDSDCNYSGVIPVGYPVDDVEVIVVDEDRMPLLNFQIGEIAIKSKYLSKGYWRQKQMTEEKFKVVDQSTGEKIFYTGDVGRFSLDGCLFYLGRKDFQVKIRGQRVELAEIEQTMLKVQGIKNAIVCEKEIDGSQKICAYFQSDVQISIQEILDCLRKYLPEYMLPTCINKVNSFPLTNSGKVDRLKLPLFPVEQNDESFQKVTLYEDKLLDIWSDLLNKNKSNSLLDYSFFELGGNSLSSIQLISRIRSEFSVALTIEDVFRNQTIRSLSKLIQAKSISKKIFIPKSPLLNSYPLTPALKSIWFICKKNEMSTAFNLVGAYKISRDIDILKMQTAFNKIIEDFEILRTIFIEEDGEPVMRVVDIPPGKTYVDIEQQNLPNENAIYEYMMHLGNTKFNLEKGPLLKVVLLQLSPNSYVLSYVIHHIIADGWSVGVFEKHLLANYESDLSIQKPEIQFKDFAWWNNIQISQNERQKKYWEQKLSGELNIVELPLLRSRPLLQTYASSNRIYEISEKHICQLRELASSQNATMFILFSSILNVLLYKYSHRRDIIIGTDCAGRNSIQLESQIGYFLKMLPLRNYVSANDSMKTFIMKVKKCIMEAFDNQDYPIENIIEDLGLTDRQLNMKLFNILILYQNFERFSNLSENAKISRLDIRRTTSFADVTFEFIEVDDNISLNICYNNELFECWQIDKMFIHLVQIIDHLLQNIDVKIEDINLNEESIILRKMALFNRIKKRENKNIIELFLKQVERTPNSIAIECNGRTLTYKLLHDYASFIAFELVDRYKVRPGDYVGILLHKNENAIITILGCLYAGAVYIPLDIHSPMERVENIMLEYKIMNIIFDPSYHNINLNDINKIDICYFLGSFDTQHFSFYNEFDPDPESIAYIMFTSGSTGKPKGIMINHKSLLDYSLTFSEQFNINGDDAVIQHSSLSFDTSIEEIFPILINGGRLQIVEDGGRDIESILSLIENDKANILSSTPMHINELNQQSSRLKKLRLLISGGDVLLLSHIDNIIGLIEIYNTYGPTEATVCASYMQIRNKEDVYSIGKPITNKPIYIVNCNLEIQDVGIEGEICIGGDYLFNGYINQPEETSKKLISIPPLGTIYRTGDRGMFTNDGFLIFKGRIDEQLKIRGMRVELEEIRYVIAQHPEIIENYVVAKKNVNDIILVSYYTLLSNSTVTDEDLNEWCKSQLPGYMIPTIFMKIDFFPMNINGKINRNELPNPIFNKTNNLIYPATEIENKLSKLWSEILAIDTSKISVVEDFFKLGGHSLKLNRLKYKIEDTFKITIELKILFELTTIRQQGKFLENAKSDIEDCHIKAIETTKNYNVSIGQRRLWLLSKIDGGNIAYNLTFAYKIIGAIDICLLEKAISKLIKRHESLRTIFVENDGFPIMKVVDDFDIGDIFSEYNVSDYSEKDVDELIKEQSNFEFELNKGPLIRICILHKDVNKHILLISAHHIIIDGWSMEILIRDLIAFYYGKTLVDLEIQFKDYVSWKLEKANSCDFKSEIKYWMEKLSNELPILNIPTIKARPRFKTYNGKKNIFNICNEMTKRIYSFCEKENVTLFVALLSFVKHLLFRYSGQTDIIVGTSVSGRNNIMQEEQIGFYVNTLAIRTLFNEHDNFRLLLNKVKSVSIEAFNNQTLDFESILENLNIKRDLSRNPLFDVMVVLQNTNRNTLNIDEVKDLMISQSNISNSHNTSKFDITFSFTEKKDYLECDIEYNTDLFDTEYIERLFNHFLKIISFDIDEPEIKLNDFSIITEDENKILLEKFYTENKELKNKCIIELFEESVVKYSSNIAIKTNDDKVLTYREFYTKVKSLAHTLLANGVKKGDVIAIISERSVDLLVGAYAILKSGAIYLPISINNPRDRIKYLLKDSKANYLLYDDDFKEIDYYVNDISSLNLSQCNYSNEVQIRYPKVLENDIAYIIYTSGSTGEPKGVKIRHDSLSELIQIMHKKYPVKKEDVFLFKTNHTFDVSITELFGWFFEGGKLVILDKGREKDPFYIYDKIISEDVTHINFVPSMFSVFLESINSKIKNNAKIKYLLLAGEALSSELVKKFNSLEMKAELVNLYGPTEATIYASSYSLSKWNDKMPVYIGKPLPNVKMFVCNSMMQIQPIGVVGEIYIGGNCLASEYTKDEESNSAFIDHCFFDMPIRLYKTGDFACYSMDWNLEFKGRYDTQVKIRGYRIELKEIESCISTHPSVKECIVMVSGTSSLNKKLVVYYKSKKKNIEKELRKLVKLNLPLYMVPDIYVEVTEFPKNVNGKIDFNKLPMPSLNFDFERKKIPNNEVEKKLIKICSELVNVKEENIGINDNIFELGANSIMVAMLINRIREEFNVEILFNEVYESVDIECIAKIIVKSNRSNTNSIIKIDRNTL